MFNHFALIAGWAAALFWGWVLYRGFFSKKKKPFLIVILGRVLRFVLIVMTFGLAACSNPDPLAVASGPVFQLNPGYWHPAPQDLAGPPVIAAK